MPNYHITIHGVDREAMADLVRAHRVRVYGQTLTEEDTGYRVSALANDEAITRLKGAGYRVERHEDVVAENVARNLFERHIRPVFLGIGAGPAAAAATNAREAVRR